MEGIESALHTKSSHSAKQNIKSDVNGIQGKAAGHQKILTVAEISSRLDSHLLNSKTPTEKENMTHKNQSSKSAFENSNVKTRPLDTTIASAVHKSPGFNHKNNGDLNHSSSRVNTVSINSSVTSNSITTEDNVPTPSIQTKLPNISTPKNNLSNMTTPTSARTLSLKDRIRLRMQENATLKTARSPGVLREQMREEAIDKARKEANMVKMEGSVVDIGPFYGLPSKVHKLLQTHRGISKLYGKTIVCNLKSLVT